MLNSYLGTRTTLRANIPIAVYHSHVNILQLIAAPHLSAFVIDIIPTLTQFKFFKLHLN